ncbi:ADP-ribosylglycohydrolase family protein [Oleidesulfovibrio sp.]|uniref:ADP-ribosylglycohydrolase family protein n=1 Tax=Oleidesulfovibrio sp. TaxID=2909707 RepID=UPI003A866605
MSKIRSAILASFVADSLALGAHWEYDRERIEKTLGRISKLVAPRLNAHHPTKEAGDLSHYGDQTLLLLKTVAETRDFSLQTFAEHWQQMMKEYTGYIDRASRDTMARFAQGSPPDKTGAVTGDFSGASRVAPLLAILGDDLDRLIDAARAQCLMTHGSVLVADGAEFMARSAHALLQGHSMPDAFLSAATAGYTELPAEDWLAFAEMHTNMEGAEAITRFGQACGMKGAMLSVIQLAIRYEDNPAEGLVENVMGGGDSCARGLALGMLLGARHGQDWIPVHWLSDLRSRDAIEDCFTRLWA